MIRLIKNLGHFFIALTAVIFYRFPAKRLTVIGVTGTDGKTTTSTLIYHILKTAGLKVALLSTVAAYIGKEKINTGFHVTSPNPWLLQKLLKKIVKREYQYVVLEATSHGLDQHRLLGSNITIGVLTNITHEHLDYHKTYTRYTKAKSKLFSKAKVAIINRDDRSFQPIKSQIPKSTRIVSYSLKKPKPDFINQSFPQNYNRSNALAAMQVAIQLKIRKQIIKQAMTTFPGVKGRMDEIKNNSGVRIIVDFAHTPNALINALQFLKKTTKGKLIAVYGAAGLRDYNKRPLMGDVGARLADETILTAEDPRSEDVNTIIWQMKDGITTNHAHVHEISDRQRAINFAINHLAKKGDTVGIIGKGHEQAMNLDGKTETPWSDHQAVLKALKKEKS